MADESAAGQSGFPGSGPSTVLESSSRISSVFNNPSLLANGTQGIFTSDPLTQAKLTLLQNAFKIAGAIAGIGGVNTDAKKEKKRAKDDKDFAGIVSSQFVENLKDVLFGNLNANKKSLGLLQKLNNSLIQDRDLLISQTIGIARNSNLEKQTRSYLDGTLQTCRIKHDMDDKKQAVEICRGGLSDLHEKISSEQFQSAIATTGQALHTLVSEQKVLIAGGPFGLAIPGVEGIKVIFQDDRGPYVLADDQKTQIRIENETILKHIESLAPAQTPVARPAQFMNTFAVTRLVDATAFGTLYTSLSQQAGFENTKALAMAVEMERHQQILKDLTAAEIKHQQDVKIALEEINKNAPYFAPALKKAGTDVISFEEQVLANTKKITALESAINAQGKLLEKWETPDLMKQLEPVFDASGQLDEVKFKNILAQVTEGTLNETQINTLTKEMLIALEKDGVRIYRAAEPTTSATISADPDPNKKQIVGAFGAAVIPPAISSTPAPIQSAPDTSPALEANKS